MTASSSVAETNWFQEETKLIGYQEAQPHSKLEYAPLALLGGTAKLGGKRMCLSIHRNSEELGTIIQSSLGLCAKRIQPKRLKELGLGWVQ